MRISSARAAALALAFLALASPFAPGARADEANEVNVYSYRQPYPIDPLFKAFTARTGIKVNATSLRKKASELVDKVGFDDGPSS
jgi:iron(III) transport system substrate-binding protein